MHWHTSTHVLAVTGKRLHQKIHTPLYGGGSCIGVLEGWGDRALNHLMLLLPTLVSGVGDRNTETRVKGIFKTLAQATQMEEHGVVLSLAFLFDAEGRVVIGSLGNCTSAIGRCDDLGNHKFTVIPPHVPAENPEERRRVEALGATLTDGWATYGENVSENVTGALGKTHAGALLAREPTIVSTFLEPGDAVILATHRLIDEEHPLADIVPSRSIARRNSASHLLDAHRARMYNLDTNAALALAYGLP